MSKDRLYKNTPDLYFMNSLEFMLKEDTASFF